MKEGGLLATWFSSYKNRAEVSQARLLPTKFNSCDGLLHAYEMTKSIIVTGTSDRLLFMVIAIM